MPKQMIGYVHRINSELNPGVVERFRYNEASYTRRIGPRSDTVRSKLFYCSLDYEDVASNTRFLQKNPKLVLVNEPFFVDDELRERIKNGSNGRIRRIRKNMILCMNYFTAASHKKSESYTPLQT